MQNFEIIDDIAEIKLGKEWRPAKTFKSQGQLVNHMGCEKLLNS